MKTIILLLSLMPATLSFASKGYTVDNRTPVINGVKLEVPVTVSNTNITGQISITSSTEGIIEFFIFDLNGQLAYEARLENKQTKTINGLKKGIYIYTVQLKDQKLEEGKIFIK